MFSERVGEDEYIFTISKPNVGELSSDLGGRSGMFRAGLKVAALGGRPLNLFPSAEGAGLGLFIGSIARRGNLLGIRNFSGESSSGSSGAIATLGGGGRLDMWMTLDRLWPFRPLPRPTGDV